MLLDPIAREYSVANAEENVNTTASGKKSWQEGFYTAARVSAWNGEVACHESIIQVQYAVE